MMFRFFSLLSNNQTFSFWGFYTTYLFYVPWGLYCAERHVALFFFSSCLVRMLLFCFVFYGYRDDSCVSVALSPQGPLCLLDIWGSARRKLHRATPLVSVVTRHTRFCLLAV